MQKETIIISLGGSLVAPGEIDFGFLKSFRHSLEKYVKEKKFFVLAGGGKICRVYQNALLEFGAKNNERDWIGIDVTKLNAWVVKQVFVNHAYPKVITNPNKKINTNKSIIVGAGYRPGWSTDYDAVLIAKKYKVKTIINLSNIDYVYDVPLVSQSKNPIDFANAKPIEKIDWQSFCELVGNTWTPGLNTPFDPKASKLAKKLKLRVAIINGKKIDRLEDFLNGKQFIGTIIE